MIELKVGCNRGKYPSGNIRFDPGKTSDVMQTGGSLVGTAGARSHSDSGAGGTVRVSNRRVGGAHVPAEIRRWGDVQVVGGPANERFGGPDRQSLGEGLRAGLDQSAAGR